MPQTKVYNVAIALAVAGCTVGPDYRPVETHAPTDWSSPVSNGLIGGTSAPASWWASFNDPELDSLFLRAAKTNPDVRVAEARLRQSRGVREMNIANFWPTLDSSVSEARAKQSMNQPLIGALPLPPNFPFEYNVYNAGFDAAWEIDVFG